MKKVLEYRERLENDAKLNYLGVREKVREAENQFNQMLEHQKELEKEQAFEIHALLMREKYMIYLKDRMKECQRTLLDFKLERLQAETVWLEKRKEAMMLRKLDDKKRLAWQKRSALSEQSQLDEYGLIRYNYARSR